MKKIIYFHSYEQCNRFYQKLCKNNNFSQIMLERLEDLRMKKLDHESEVKILAIDSRIYFSWGKCVAWSELLDDEEPYIEFMNLFSKAKYNKILALNYIKIKGRS